MSGFTDNDLKRLRELLKQHFDFNTAWDLNESMDLVKALIARLEAAEHAMHAAFSAPSAQIQDPGYYAAWKKAAGKE